MKKLNILLSCLLILLSFSASQAEVLDSIQPTENIYQIIVKPSHRLVQLNLISNFGNVEVPTTTIITHANNDFKILRFEKDLKGIWHLAKKDTILGYTETPQKIILGIQKNLAIKKSAERVGMIIVVNVPSFWTLPESRVKLALSPWTLDRVGRLQEYDPGSPFNWEKNFKALYGDIRENVFAEPWQKVNPQIQKSFNLVSLGSIYISKGLTEKLTSRSYTANRYQFPKHKI